MMKTTKNPPLTTEEQETKVRALLAAAYPDSAPPPALRARVARHAQQSAQISANASYWLPRFAPRRIGWGVAAALGVSLVTATIAFYPRWAAAKSLEKIQAAMLDVKNIHGTYFEVGQGEIPDRNVEIWQTGNATLTEERRPSANGDGTLLKRSLTADGKHYQFDPQQNRVTVQRDNPRFTSSGFTIADMKNDYLRWGWKDVIRDLGVTMWDGRLAKQVSIERDDPSGPTQFLLLVDPTTDLPFRYEFKIKLRGSDEWETRIVGESNYNAAIPADFFAPNFPPGAAVVDLDAEQENFRQRLAKGIASETLADGRRIVVRNVQANRDGTVFLLYTAGKRPGDQFLTSERFAGRDWRIEVSDNQGNSYLPYNQQIISHGLEADDIEHGLVYNGERLEADVWVPKTPLSPSPSRRVTVTFRANPVNLHGNGWEKVKFTETAAFTLPLVQASEGLAPDFAPDITLHLDEDAVAKLQADARGDFPPGVRPSPELIGEFVGCKDSVSGLAFSPDGKTLMAGTGVDGVRLWDVANRRVTRAFPASRPGGETAVFAPNGSGLAILTSIYDDKKRRYSRTEMQMFDLATNRKLWAVPVNNDGLGAPAFSPDGQTLTATGFHADQMEKGPDGEEYIARMSGRLKRWDANTGAEKGGIAVGESLFHPALTPAQDKLITLQNVKGTRIINDRPTQDIIGSEANVWDAHTGAMIRSLPVLKGTILGIVTVSPDGSLIAAGGGERVSGRMDGGILLLWNSRTGELVQTLRSKGAAIESIVFSPDNSLLLASGADDQKTISVWNLRTGRQIPPLIGHGRLVQGIAFSPNGAFLASSDLNGRILLWRTPAH